MKRYFLLIFLCISKYVTAQVDTSYIYPQRTLQISDSTRSGYVASIKIGNPTNKDVEMAMEDRAISNYRYDLRYSNKWFEFKKKLNADHGIQMTFNYSPIFVASSSTIRDDGDATAASGIFDATIKWNLINNKVKKNQGSVIFWADNRHLYYGDIAPQFHFQESGTAALTAVKFNEWDTHVLEFYYQQALLDNRIGFVIGKIDMPDWFTYNALAHPNLHFTDLTFLVSPTVSWSNPGMGVLIGGWLDKRKRFGLTAGLNDVAGADLKTVDFLDMGADQWGSGNFLKMAELAYTPERAQYYSTRISATLWHSDELLAADDSYFQTPSGQGITFQASWTEDAKYIRVFKMAFADGDGVNALSKTNVAIMHGWNLKYFDMLAIGLNYTRSSITNEDQYMSEIFYRWTLSKTTHFTPHVKFVINPALDPEQDFLFYYGIRGRISF